MNIVTSIIIPSHNRSASLKKMLQSLARQSYPQQNFEVIVVADGCKDDTVDLVKNYSASFQLSFFELPGVGAAAARNKGASLATGRYLIFVDDDMEPSVDFINEHIVAHKNENNVVIGYSPLMLKPKASIQRLSLHEWWEEKFQAMRDKRYRFKYDDLTSGNFSISTTLFKKVNGFDTTLLCREDYELGFRLIETGAQFCFPYKAKAIHRDEVTDLKRSLQRKKSEGMADMQIKDKHPGFINKEAFYYLNHRSFAKSILLRAIQFAPSICDSMANFSLGVVRLFDKMKMLSSWQKLNYRLHQYWYLRGLMTNAGSAKKLYQKLESKKVGSNENQPLKIDLKIGLEKVEEQIDEVRPLSLEIFYGTKLIGNLEYDSGAEPIKGLHLRNILKEKFSDELASVLLPEAYPEAI